MRSRVMPDFTTALPDTYFRVPQRTVWSLLDTCRQDQFTGLLRLRYPSGVDLVSTFLDGAQNGLYGCHNQKMEVIPRQSWAYSMDRPDASIACLNLSVEALRLVRITHEAPVSEMEQAHCTAHDLSARVQAWFTGTSPIILLHRMQQVEKVYLIAGCSTPIIEELAIEGGQARFSIVDATFTGTRANEESEVRWFISDGDHDLWQELRLRYAFSPLTRMVINRFSQLAGRVLTERVCGQLTGWLREAGWQIGLTINGVANRHYFESLQQARTIYLEIVRRFNHEASLAIGLRMAEGLWWDTLLKMDTHRRDLLKKYFYDQNGLDHAMAARRIES